MSEPRSAAPCNVMLSAAGRRVALRRLLAQSLAELGVDGHVVATDITRTSPAFHDAEHRRLVPPYRDPQCLDALLRLCREERVRCIIPTIDPDLPFYARHRDRFAEAGAWINISSAETIDIGNDKQNTHAWLVARGLPTVRQASAGEVLDGAAGWPFPLFAKPRRGAAGIGAGVVEDRDELARLAKRHDCIVQSIAPGDEYTVDVFVDDRGVCRCAVPRKRLETRAGEVSKGVTCRVEPVIELARRVAEALPGARGVMNIQVFYDSASGELNVNEINARFGGGYPLAHAAGAPMARWVIEQALGRETSATDADWRDGVVMLRYDAAVFVSASNAGLA